MAPKEKRSLYAAVLLLAVLLAVCIGGLTSAQAEILTMKIAADKDIFKDSSGVYRVWDGKMYIGQFIHPYYHSTVAMGFNLADTELDTLPIVSIKLVIYRTFWSGSMEVVFTETEDDDWQNSNSSRFPSLIDPQEVLRVDLDTTGRYKSEDIQDYILEQYNSGDHYLSIIMSTESTTQNGSFYANEDANNGPYLEVLYGHPAADLSTASDLTETALDGMQLDLEITDEAFVETGLTPGMFTLDSISQAGGVTVSSVDYIDETHARLTLAYTGDVDEHYDLSVTVSGDVLTTGEPMTSNSLAIHACDEIMQGGTYDLDDLGELPDVRVYTTEHVTFTQTSAAEKENCVIRNMVPGVDLELAGVNINNDVSGSWAGIDFQGTGNTLILTGENTIKTYNDPILRVTIGTALMIDGTGSLTADVKTSAAAIGSGKSETLGDVIINGGTIHATCTQSGGAAIGTGADGSSIGTVTINGGTITAQGGTGAAGIGCGNSGDMTSVTINGGTITAIGGEDSAGIGSGEYSKMTSVTVNGGVITARGGGPNGAGIGTGYYGKMDTVTITGGTITAGYTGGGVGIGAGHGGQLGTIHISGGVIDARWGGSSDPAIGRDSNSDVDHIHITGGLIFADGYESSCDDIGYGKEQQYALDMDVQISGGAVVFLCNNKLADRDDGITVPFHDNETITDHQAYGFAVPDDWSGTAYAYIPSSHPVTGISVTPESERLNLSIAETYQVTAEVVPFYADNKAYTYSSLNPGVATVDDSGHVTPVSAGTATITATTDDGGFTDSCTVTVYIGASGISLAPQEATLYVDAAVTGKDTITLTPTFTPEDAEDQTVSYHSSNTGAATVDAGGTVRAVSAGTATITVTANDGGYTDTCLITVNQCATGVSVSPDAAELVLGDNNTANNTVALSAVFTPLDAYDKTVTWESLNPDIVTVDSAGLVTALTAGNAKVKLTTQDGGFTAEATIIVKQSATGVSLGTHQAALVLGDADTSNDSIQLDAIVEPDDATETGLVWASGDESVATVDTSGLVTAVHYGAADISVTTANGLHTDTCTVNVYQSATGIVVNPTFKILVLDYYSDIYESTQLSATVLPEGANQAVTWVSSNTDAATVDETGRVAGQEAGNTVITVTSVDGGFSAEATIVVQQAATSVTVSPTEATLILGDGDTSNDKVVLTTEVLPDNAREKKVSYQNSNYGVVYIDDDTVTAIKAGTADIKVVTENGRTAVCKITVLQYVTEISLNKTTATLGLDDGNPANDTLQLTAAIDPDNASDKTVAWVSSDPEVAAVSSDGLVTALKAGEAEITATTAYSEKTASCLITVTQSATGLSVSPASALLVLGDEDTGNDSVTLEATIQPGNADEQGFAWESSDSSVATVDAQGRVTPHKKGEATITATSKDGGYTANCDITVQQYVTGISLNETKVTLMLEDGNPANDTLQLTATVKPDDASDKTVAWVSSDPEVATVSSNGLVTALKAGTAEITAKAANNGKEASCRITVTQSVTGLSVSPAKALLVLGDEDTKNDSVTLEATIQPGNADEQGFTWKSSDPSVATVDAQGRVTPRKKGEATITATSTDGGYAAACAITVEQRLMLHGSCQGGKVCLGNRITITPSLGGGTWSYDPALVSLKGNIFTPLKAGTTVVTYTLDGKGRSGGLLQTVLHLLLRSAFAENIEEASFTITTEPLALSSSVTGNLTGIPTPVTLTPNFTGGSWDYDMNILTRSGNTFAPKATGTTTITYTYDGHTVDYELQIIVYSPQTGDGRLPYWLLDGLMLLCGCAVLLLRKRIAR